MWHDAVLSLTWQTFTLTLKRQSQKGIKKQQQQQQQKNSFCSRLPITIGHVLLWPTYLVTLQVALHHA